MIGPTLRAGEIVRATTERIDAFYLMGGEEKRLRAADEGLTQLDVIDELKPAVAVARATLEAVDDRLTRIAASRAALQAIGQRTAELAAGTCYLGSIALAAMDGLSGGVREKAAAAAFSALPSDAWTGYVAGLAGTGAESRLRLAEGRPSGTVEAQAARACDMVVLAGSHDRLGLVKALLAGMPADARVSLLGRLADVPGIDADAVQAGLRALGQNEDVGAALVGSCSDDSVAAAAGRVALGARPAGGWRAWAEPLLGAGDASDAAVLKTALSQEGKCDPVAVAALLPGLSDSVGASSLLTSLENELARARSPRAADVASLRALCARQGIADGEALRMAVAFAGDQPLTASALAAQANALLEDVTDSDRADALACGVLREAAALGDDYARVLAAPLQVDMADASQQARAARVGLDLLAGEPPGSLTAAAEACQRQAEGVEWPEDSLRILGVTLPLIAGYAKRPDESEMVRLLTSAATMDGYEASTVLRGIGEAIGKMEDGLPAVASALAGNMNYWVDEARAARAGVESIERLALAQGDSVRGACARFLLRLDDQVDVSNENDRSKALIAGIDWLAENSPSRLEAGLGQLARELRSANEDDMRDVRTGHVAADMMAEAAAAGNNAQLGAEAAFLQFLAGRHAENVGERRDALFEAMQVQRDDDSDGAQRLARMGKAAVEAYAQPAHDKADVALACVAGIGRLDRTASVAASEMSSWMGLRLYGAETRGVVAQHVIDAYASCAHVAPGTVAAAARGVLDEVDGVNVFRMGPVVLDSVEKVARSMGDEQYVPELVNATRDSLKVATTDDERRERLMAGLEELSTFQGDTFAQVIAAAKLGKTSGDARIEKGDGEVVIGGIRVPRKDA